MDDPRELRIVKPCGAHYQGLRCVLPEGHLGNHAASITLPADVGQMIDAHVTAMEEAERRLRIARRWLYAACAVNLAAGLFNLIGILT
jgi:hypothetical protein